MSYLTPLVSRAAERRSRERSTPVSRPVLAARGTLVAAITVIAALGAVSPASASHLKGGSISTAIVDSTGNMTIHLKNLERNTSCSIAGETYEPTLEITAPDGTTQVEVDASFPATRCLGETIVYEGDETVDLNDPDPDRGFGPDAPAGVYTVSLSDCCRVSGIINSSDSSFSLSSRVRYIPGQTTASPRYIGSTSTGAAQGYEYRGDVTAADPDGGTVSYGLTQKDDVNAPYYDSGAPDTNVVSLVGSLATVSAAVTGGWNVGDYFVYKTQANDDQGERADQDILVTVTDNRPPMFDALPDPFTIAAGSASVLPISASDPDASGPKIDTVSISRGALPAWATWNTSDGNPATAQLSLNPPVGVGGIFLIALEAADDDPIVTLLDSKVLRVRVVPAAPAPASGPAVTTTGATTTVRFDTVAGASYECSLDGGDWTICTGTSSFDGLAPGRHTFRVRQTSDAGPGAPLTIEFDVAGAPAAAPAAPATAAAPAQAAAQCVSRRTLTVHWRLRKGVKPGRFTVSVSGKRPVSLPASARSAVVRMAGKPRTTVKVKITTRARGRKLGITRTFRTCDAKVKHPRLRSLLLRNMP